MAYNDFRKAIYRMIDSDASFSHAVKVFKILEVDVTKKPEYRIGLNVDLHQTNPNGSFQTLREVMELTDGDNKSSSTHGFVFPKTDSYSYYTVAKTSEDKFEEKTIEVNGILDKPFRSFFYIELDSDEQSENSTKSEGVYSVSNMIGSFTLKRKKKELSGSSESITLLKTIIKRDGVYSNGKHIKDIFYLYMAPNSDDLTPSTSESESSNDEHDKLYEGGVKALAFNNISVKYEVFYGGNINTTITDAKDLGKEGEEYDNTIIENEFDLRVSLDYTAKSTGTSFKVERAEQAVSDGQGRNIANTYILRADNERREIDLDLKLENGKQAVIRNNEGENSFSINEEFIETNFPTKIKGKAEFTKDVVFNDEGGQFNLVDSQSKNIIRKDNGKNIFGNGEQISEILTKDTHLKIIVGSGKDQKSYRAMGREELVQAVSDENDKSLNPYTGKSKENDPVTEKAVRLALEKILTNGGDESKGYSDHESGIIFNKYSGFSAGENSQATSGAAIGKNADTTSGVALGEGAQSKTGGIAVGSSARSEDSTATAIGINAVATKPNSIQLGSGTNKTESSLQFLNHTVIDGKGQLFYKNKLLPDVIKDDVVNCENGSSPKSRVLYNDKAYNTLSLKVENGVLRISVSQEK